jgi:3-oxoacyl-[acyl-carrier protein] reductase
VGTLTEPRRVAIVTGAGRGIGAATAIRLAEAGTAVGVLDIAADACEQTAEKINVSGGTALAAPADVTDDSQVKAAVAHVAAELGAPTVLVNNAGVVRDRLFEDMTDEDWNVVLDVNLRGAFLACRAVRQHMVSAGWGRIINMSSASADGNREQVNYSSAKAGILGMTRALALELGPAGVTVNAIAPGYIVTDMTRATAARMGADFGKLQRTVARRTPVRRVGHPEDIAAAVAFLASEGAGFITGQVLYVTGGLVL